MNQVVGSWSAMVRHCGFEIVGRRSSLCMVFESGEASLRRVCITSPNKGRKPEEGGVQFGVKFVDTKKLQCTRVMILTKANEMVVFLV